MSQPIPNYVVVIVDASTARSKLVMLMWQKEKIAKSSLTMLDGMVNMCSRKLIDTSNGEIIGRPRPDSNECLNSYRLAASAADVQKVLKAILTFSLSLSSVTVAIVREFCGGLGAFGRCRGRVGREKPVKIPAVHQVGCARI